MALVVCFKVEYGYMKPVSEKNKKIEKKGNTYDDDALFTVSSKGKWKENSRVDFSNKNLFD